MNKFHAQRRAMHILTPVTLACALAACGGDNNSSTTPPATHVFSGKVVASSFTPDVSGNPVLKAGYYAGATVFIDAHLAHSSSKPTPVQNHVMRKYTPCSSVILQSDDQSGFSGRSG